MREQDPLKVNRLGLRGVLLVSGGVLAATTVFLTPDIGLLRGPASTADLSAASSATGSPGSAEASGDAVPQGGGSATASDGSAEVLLPVYWLGEVDGTERLFREYLRSPNDASLDPIAESVRRMTAGEPLDPDYGSPWRSASSVSSSISTRNVITLDISSDALSESLSEETARLALQQLVYTATAAAANAGLIAGGESSSVVVLVDGSPGYRAFGAVELEGEWTRDPAVLSPVWIIDPQEDTQADGGALTIHGLAPAAEGSVRWRIDRMDDDTVPADGTQPGAQTGEQTGTRTDGTDATSADSGSLFRDGAVDIEPGEAASGIYSFSQTLPAGRYEITVSVPAGDGSAEDSKTVVVR